MRVLLFDIDLTLVNTGGAGRIAMTRAFTELFGADKRMDGVSFAGRTDRVIFRDAVEQNQLPWRAEDEEAFKQRYLTYLRAEIKKPNPRQHVEPGIPELLEVLSQRPDVALGLLTGNWRAGAEIKLEHFGLFHYFRFGAFADDAESRNDLPAVARRRFQETFGQPVAASDMFIIGDTPLDVACAKPFGAKAVSVATGFFSYEELAACHPDYLFHDLSNTEAFLKILNGRA